MQDYGNIGQDKPTKTPQDEYDSKHGSYSDGLEKLSTDERLPLAEMPKAPDPKPYK
jgi:hypothetical protein